MVIESLPPDAPLAVRRRKRALATISVLSAPSSLSTRRRLRFTSPSIFDSEQHVQHAKRQQQEQPKVLSSADEVPQPLLLIQAPEAVKSPAEVPDLYLSSSSSAQVNRDCDNDNYVDSITNNNSDTIAAADPHQDNDKGSKYSKSEEDVDDDYDDDGYDDDDDDCDDGVSCGNGIENHEEEYEKQNELCEEDEKEDYDESDDEGQLNRLDDDGGIENEEEEDDDDNNNVSKTNSGNNHVDDGNNCSRDKQQHVETTTRQQSKDHCNKTVTMSAKMEQQQARLDQQWYEKYWELVKYKEKTGHCSVPYRTGDSLYYWVVQQRCLYTRGKLNAHRVAALNRLGVQLEQMGSYDNHWQRMFYQLKEFNQKTGRFPSKIDEQDNSMLCRWTRKQRATYKMGKIAPERIQALNSIHFPWKQVRKSYNKEKNWSLMYLQLQEFKQKTGHCMVPFRKNKQLWRWVHLQRQIYSRKELSKKSYKLLSDIGFSWEAYADTSWKERFEELVEFHREFGHFRVPPTYKDGTSLLTWVMKQRRKFHLGKLSADQIEALNSINFSYHQIKKPRRKIIPKTKQKIEKASKQK